jgi:hypothetical protein
VPLQLIEGKIAAISNILIPAIALSVPIIFLIKFSDYFSVLAVLKDFGSLK